MVWPTDGGNTRLGYSTSAGIYLPASTANGLTVSLVSGSATAYAGQPDASSHRALGSISPGQPLVITGLAAGEVVSVQSGSPFSYGLEYAPADPTEPDPTEPDPTEPDPTEPDPTDPDPTDPGDGPASSAWVTWSCTSSPCPWGGSVSGEALVWPADGLNVRFGYTTSAAIYLPASSANGLTVSLLSGTAAAYAGLPDASSHRLLGSISPGQPLDIAGLSPGEVVSVQSDGVFTYELALTPADPVDPEPEDPSDPPSDPDPTDPGEGPASSAWVTWTCVSSPCPWGGSTAGDALVWPTGGVSTRLGYTTSAGIYLPASSANGMTVSLLSGTAAAYAGLPDAPSHRVVGSISPGQPLTIAGLAPGEVVSVQSNGAFTYELEFNPADPDPVDPGEADPDPTDPVDVSTSSASVTWNCTSSPCPWGSPLDGHALVWPASADALSSRLGYTTSAAIYLPAANANGLEIGLDSGTAGVYAGLPNADSHRFLATITPGSPYLVAGLVDGEVLSVQSSASFTYYLAAGDPSDPSDPTDPDDGWIDAIPAIWYCNQPGCTSSPWTSAVVSWPWWAAYENNNRSGENSRTVYDANGNLLYPYMGPWADGCEVTAQSGTVLIIEWQRGTDTWRQTWLEPGQTHVIDLTSPEDNAMIESYDGSPGFSVTLDNCNPEPIR